MRILVVSNLYPPVVRGGYERECFAVVEHLRREHEVIVVTSKQPTTGGVARWNQPLPYVRDVLHFLPMNWRGSLQAPLASLRASRAVMRIMQEFKPELIYVWNGAQLPASAILVAGRTGVPVAFRICEYWFGGLGTRDQFVRHLRPGDRGLRAAWAQLLRLFNRHPSLQIDPEKSFPAAVCWNSDYVRAVTPVPPSVAPIHEDRVYPALPQGDRFRGLVRTPSTIPSVVLFGRISPEKGVEVACRAIAALESRHGVHATLKLAGPVETTMKRKVERLTAELRIQSQVESCGQLDTNGLIDLLGAAHVVVVPPTWEEPAPLVCVEAALARIPVVASRSGGIPELLHDQEHALLFEIGDADGCADRLAETMRDHAATSARVERAFARAEELSFQPYIEAMDRFLDNSVKSLVAADRGT